MTIVRTEAAERAPPWTRELRGVIHDTDKRRFWVEDPEHERFGSIYVPPAVAVVLDERHVHLFYSLDTLLTWANSAGVAQLNMALLYG